MSKPFDYEDLDEAWVDFTKSAQKYFVSVLKSKAKEDPDIIKKAKKLKYREFTARFMYILSLLAPREGDVANLDWAIVLARPPTVGEAQEALKEMVAIKIINIGDEHIGPVAKKAHPPENGGDTTPETKFNFD